MAIQVQLKRGALANRPSLASGEAYWATDTNQLFIGPTPTLINSGGTSADIALSLFAPVGSESIPAGNSAVIVRKYTIASGTKLTISSGARLRLL
jgi:hypothetical protein